MAKNIDFMGAIFPDVPSVKLPQQGGGLVAFDDTTDATATADKILQGYTAYANGQKLVGTASGGITPSGTYSITSNGTYDVTQYASADVNVSGGGGGDHDAEDGLVTRALSEYSNDRVTIVGGYAFNSYNTLKTVEFPNVISIGSNAFNWCTALIAASFPKAQYIYSYAFNYCASLAAISFPNVLEVRSAAFNNCSKLAVADFPKVQYLSQSAFNNCLLLSSVSFPNLRTVGSDCFKSCKSLTTVSLPMVGTISTSAFRNCSNLMSVYLLRSSVVVGAPNMFTSTPMSVSTYTGSFGSIYVPASLVDSYKSATYWNYFSNRITAYEGE